MWCGFKAHLHLFLLSIPRQDTIWGNPDMKKGPPAMDVLHRIPVLEGRDETHHKRGISIQEKISTTKTHLFFSVRPHMLHTQTFFFLHSMIRSLRECISHIHCISRPHLLPMHATCTSGWSFQIWLSSSDTPCPPWQSSDR